MSRFVWHCRQKTQLTWFFKNSSGSSYVIHNSVLTLLFSLLKLYPRFPLSLHSMTLLGHKHISNCFWGEIWIGGKAGMVVVHKSLKPNRCAGQSDKCTNYCLRSFQNEKCFFAENNILMDWKYTKRQLLLTKVDEYICKQKWLVDRFSLETECFLHSFRGGMTQQPVRFHPSVPAINIILHIESYLRFVQILDIYLSLSQK